MLTYLIAAVVGACLGFLAGGILSSSKVRDLRIAYLMLAEAVYHFTGRNRPSQTELQVSDLLVAPAAVRDLKQALHSSGRIYQSLGDE